MKAVLKNRWFIGGLGMLAVGLIIFFVGPMLGFGETRPLEGIIARIVTIAVVVLIWVAFLVIGQIRARKAAAEMSAGIVDVENAEADDSARSAEEVATLKAHFEEAMEVLRKTSGGKSNALYDLPWYMIIGPPGAGKTTALVNSGLRFPLADRFGKSALRGVGGTRNCDWWFTDEAILLDTAGRYTTQDSQASVDRAAWEGFLDLLKRYRKRRPINGVLVAVSATDFMIMDAATRRQHATAVRDRIRELDNHFGMRFPVYLMITKCDLVNGFVDFFEDLGSEGREQVWGVTLPLDEGGAEQSTSQQVDRELDALFARLDERTLLRLQQERDLKRRGQIYSFPRQVYSLKASIVEFVEDVFRTSRYEDTALLRGVYFSSGTQEGTPIDRVMGAISRTFGLEQEALASHSGQGRSYFLTRLLQQVVFSEAGIAGTNQKVERRRAWLQKVAYAGVFVLVGLFVTGWTLSYFGNGTVLEASAGRAAHAEALLAEIPQNRHEPEVTLDALNAVREIVGDDSATFTGLGLDQTASLNTQAQAAYRRALVNQLLPRVMLRLEQQVDQARQPLDFTYEALKAYLRLGSEKRYDAAEIGAWVTLDWESRLRREMGNERYDALTAHLVSLLAERPAQLPLPMDDAVIRRARQKIKREPLEQRVYARLKGLNVISDIPDFTILDRAGPDSLRVFVRDSGRPLSEGIPGFFTREGFERIFTSSDNYQLIGELSAEQWVLRDEVDLADNQDVSGLLLQLRDIYFAEYVQEYQNLIYDVELAPFRDARDAANILNTLSRPGDSPLSNLISEVQKETTFSSDGGADDGEDAGADEAFSAQRQRLEQLLGNTSAARAGQRVKRYSNIVEEQFADFHDLTGGATPDSSPLTHLLKLLEELADFMMLVAAEESVDGVPQHVVDRGLVTLQKIQFQAERQGQPFLKDLLVNAATSVNNIATGGVATNIEAQWQSGGLEFCRRAIGGRYPVARGAEAEIRLEDFGRFFGYGGMADKFFEAYLRDKIDTSRRPWRAAVSRGVQISPDAIGQFERAQAIKETFFRGDSSPYVGFELTPISMDPSVTQFSLTIDGQSTEYFHGPRVAQSFSWPGAEGVGEVRLEMSPGNGSPMRAERGPWAWFRVLDDFQMKPADRPETFEVVFDLGGRTATYELVARSAYNPFKLDELSAFRCPEKLSR